jgi:hypothetical protein
MPRCGSTCARREKKPDESIPDPKGRESWTPSLSPAKGPLPGDHQRSHDADRGPSARHLSAASPVVVVGEGHAPVVAVRVHP